MPAPCAVARRVLAFLAALLLTAAIVEAASAAPAEQRVPFYEDLSGPTELIRSYDNAVNRKEYRRAYGYWERPGASFSRFARGYANTTSVALTVGRPIEEGAAGSIYAQVPAVIVARHSDGTRHTFYGCYVARARNPAIEGSPNAKPTWRIYSGTMRAAPPGATSARLLIQGCRR